MSSKSSNIFFYIPNLIGYARVVLVLLSFYYMPFSPGRTVLLYMTSEILDALDGYTARRFNQLYSYPSKFRTEWLMIDMELSLSSLILIASSFGAVLDMVTDRLSTMGLIMTLASLYPKQALVYQFLAILDISSHWLQMYSSLLCGKKSHKDSGDPFLRIYYSNKIVLFTMHGGNELFLIGTYLQYFSVGPLVSLFGYYKGIWELLSFFCLPIFLLKQIANVLQLIDASKQLAAFDQSRK